jgi:NTE family protein
MTQFSLQALNTRLEEVYGRGDFERMDYRMVDRDGKRTVEVTGVDKSWGPNYLKFGLGLASDAQQTRFNVNMSHRATWLNGRGAEWRNDLQLGYRKFLTSEFYQPFAFDSAVFVAPRLALQDEPISYYRADGNRIGDYRVRYARGHLDLGVQNKFGELRVGAFAGRLKANQDFGLIDIAPSFSLNQVGYTASAVYDQIDSVRFPREGLLASLRTFGTLAEWGSGDDYNRSELFVVGAKSRGKHALQLAGYFGDTLYGELPPYDPFLLGGFLRGSGYLMDQLIGSRVGLARAVYSYELAALPAVLGRGVYVGGSLEASHANLGLDLNDGGGIRPSASLFLGADTFLGPAFLAWGQAFGDENAETLYFMLGMPEWYR